MATSLANAGSVEEDAAPLKQQVYSSIDQVMGRATPVVEVRNIAKAEGAVARLVAKMECLQPGGSVKDRVALYTIMDAEEKGLITPGKTVLIEPTSGNTSIALAMVAQQRGYKCIIVMPPVFSMERRMLLRALGAQLVLPDLSHGIAGMFKVTEELLAKTPNSHMLNQFTNQANVECHFRTTGPEIWEATAGKVDIFVAGVGTGGIITGVGRFLKTKNPNIQIVGVEPAESAVLSGGKPGPHKIQGIGAGFVSEIMDINVVDRIIPVHSDEAMEMARRLQTEDSVLVGISSGVAFAAAIKVAKEPENASKLIVTMFTSGAERYLTPKAREGANKHTLNKIKEAERLTRIAKDLTTLTFTRWSKDWATATPLFEQAALDFKLTKNPKAAKYAFTQAAHGQTKLSAHWTAAKHMEAAATLAKELGSWDEVVDLYKQASKLYVQCQKPQPGADALSKGARAVEDVRPIDAASMYMDAIRLLEDDGRELMAFDMYRATCNAYLKLQKFEDAAAILLRLGESADKNKATSSQCKAYLSAIIVYLFADCYKEAVVCHSDCSGIDNFFKSEQNQFAEQLLEAYREARADEIRRLVSTNSNVIPHLDHMIIRLARQLPRGNLVHEETPDELT